MQQHARIPAIMVPSARVDDLIASGIGRGRLRSRDFAMPFRGVRSPTMPVTQRDLAHAFEPLLQPAHVFSHTTAAVLWGLPLPQFLEQQTDIHVLAIDTDPPQMRGVVGHRSRADRVTTSLADRLAVTDPVTTFFHLAPLLGRDDLVAVGDAIVGGSSPLATLVELADGLDRFAGQRGVGRARAALALVRTGVRSRQETHLRLAYVDAGVPEPIPGYRVYDDRNRYVGELDLAWPDFRVGDEFEGDHHRTDRIQFERDIDRRESYEDARWSIVRVTAQQLWKQRPALIRPTVDRLRARGARW